MDSFDIPSAAIRANGSVHSLRILGRLFGAAPATLSRCDSFARSESR